jgi:response regulator of citrate/malate metabolism
MIKVMIIEDDPMVRDINLKFLKKLEGFELCCATGSIKEASEVLKNSYIDLVLLDVFLPKENGLDFLKHLRKEEISSDVILITADKSIGTVQEAFRFGAVDYLVKPFTFERFKEALLKFQGRFTELKKFKELEQDTIDKFVSSPQENEGTVYFSEEKSINLKKGLNEYTYEKVMRAINNWEKESFTAEELSEFIGMARVTVRRYLEYMEGEGRIDIIMEYGKVGRPQHKYRRK